MKVLVIGGTRFIGRHVVPRLLEDGHEVCLFNRGQHPVPFAPGTVQVVQGDRKVPGDLAAKTEGLAFDAVVDMVAYNAEDIDEGVRAFAGKTGHYIFISTRSVYKRPGSSPIREDDPLEDNPNNAYGYLKVQAEQRLMAAHRDIGFPATILRLPAVYGDYDYQAREWYFIRRLFDGRRQFLLPDAGLGVNHREYAGNVADQIAFLLTKPQSAGQIYNSGHAHYNNYRDLVRMAAEILGVEVELYNAPAKDIPWSNQLAEPGITTASTGKLEALGYRERYDVRAALERTIAYFQANPIVEERPEQRNKAVHFNYDLEDALIKEKGIRFM